jgi:tetratricopeptide (TPR) repeat protein
MRLIWSFALGIVVLILGLAAIGFLYYQILKRSDDPVRIIVKTVITLGVSIPAFFFAVSAGPIGPIIIMVPAVCLGLMWAPHIGAAIASPFSGLFDGGNQEIVATPFYSIAEAKRKRGDFPGAIAEIHRQLEKFPGDYAGEMMLAGIEVEHLHNFSAGASAIERVLAQPDQSPQHVADALSQLADWHLKFSNDPEQARQALERIVERLPQTSYAQTAAQRIGHLAPKEFLEQAESRPLIHVPTGARQVGLRTDFEDLKKKDLAPTEQAAALVEHLQLHPLDTEARERLARVYTDEMQRPDLARLELEHLVSIPHQSIKQIVRWLNLIVDVQIKNEGNIEAARHTLQRIITGFSNTAFADIAQTRLAYLPMELKGRAQVSTVKMGDYDHDLGLKKTRTELEADNAARPFRNRA